jgi:hypothetical protein
MDQGTIILIIQGLIFLVLGRVIYAQEKIMKGYRDYLSIFDIDKIKKLHQWQEEIMVNKAIDVAKSVGGGMFKEQLDKYNDAMVDKLQPKFQELENIAWNLLASLPKGWQEEYIKDHMPINGEYFLKTLPEIRKQHGESFGIDPDELDRDA